MQAIVVVSTTDGASRARTGDLLRATQALSQLSYGPEGVKSSAEFEVTGPIDAKALIVGGALDPQRHVHTTGDLGRRNEVAPIERRAIAGKHIDVPDGVAAVNQSVSPSPTAAASKFNDVSSKSRPLALHANQPDQTRRR